MWLLPLLMLWSCSKRDDSPRVTAITQGSKWTLQIGSSPEETYRQLQALQEDRNFDRVALIHRPSYVAPEDIKDLLPYYDAMTLQSNTGRINRAVIRWGRDTILSVETGAGLLDVVHGWPLNYPEEMSLEQGDPTDRVYEKLSRIWQIPDYQQYQIILPDKPLNLDYDPDMAHYDQWAFTFSVDLGSGRYGQYSVRLFFKKHRLAKVEITYGEGQAYA